jgi:hypothetical protein
MGTTVTRGVKIFLVVSLANALAVSCSSAQDNWPKNFTRFGPISLDASKFSDVINWLGPNEIRLDNPNSATAIQYLCFEFTTEKGGSVFVAFEAPHNAAAVVVSTKVNTLFWSKLRPNNRDCVPTKTKFAAVAFSGTSRTSALYFFGNGRSDAFPDRLLIYDRKTEQSGPTSNYRSNGRLKKTSNVITTTVSHSFSFNQEELETLEVSKWTFITHK